MARAENAMWVSCVFSPNRDRAQSTSTKSQQIEWIVPQAAKRAYLLYATPLALG